jgi:shikimate kinase
VNDSPERNRRRGKKRNGRNRRPARNSLILIGMPGCGKSTLGKRVANMLQLPFVDTDRVLWDQTGKTAGELSTLISNEEFIQLETAAVLSVRPQQDLVIATGGSVVYSAAAMRHLRKLGMIAYIDVPLSILKRRLRNLRERGVILQPGQTLDDLFRERTRLYRRYSEITFAPFQLSPHKSASCLAHLYQFFRTTAFE